MEQQSLRVMSYYLGAVSVSPAYPNPPNDLSLLRRDEAFSDSEYVWGLFTSTKSLDTFIWLIGDYWKQTCLLLPK